MEKINLSIISYGLSYGGAHRQSMNLAKILDKEKFCVRYFWCKHNRDKYSNFSFPETNLSFLADLKQSGVETIEFHVGYRDISHPFHPWGETDFFEVFAKYPTDLIFSVRSGHTDFPVLHLNKPVIEWSVFAGIDKTDNFIYSVALSPWVQRMYLTMGGDPAKSDCCYYGITEQPVTDNLRPSLDIPNEAIVLGFHQRVSDDIFATHALTAWKYAQNLTDKKLFFVILGGSEKYKSLALALGLKVIFLPAVFNFAEVSKFLNTLDIFTHSAGLGEASGTAIQEAMFHGLPILSMYGVNNGHVDIIGDTMKIAKNQEEYNQLLVELINNDIKRAEVSRRTWERAQKLFSLSAMKEYFEKLFIQKYKEYCLPPRNFNIVSLDIYSHFSFRRTLHRILYRFPRLFEFVLRVWGFYKRSKVKITFPLSK